MITIITINIGDNNMPFAPTRFTNPFKGTLKGGIATVGNTLGLWGMYSPPNGNVRLDTVCDGAGCFTTTNTSSRFHSSYPYGTTGDWRQNSSSNELVFSDAGTNNLVGAYLFYSGTAQTKELDLKTPRTIETTAVTLTTPSNTYSIVPDVVSYVTSTQTGNPAYSAFKNITNDSSLWTRFKNETAGTYTLAGVPAALGDNLKVLQTLSGKPAM